MVLAIIGILLYAGATALGNQRGAAVRSCLDQLEGDLLDAQRTAINSGRDIALISWGSADNSSSLGLARGDVALSSSQIKTLQDGMVASPPVLPTTDPARSVAPLFRFTLAREDQNAGIAVAGSAWWTLATGGNEAYAAISPFKDDASFQAAAADAANLFQGGSDPYRVTISGLNGRFNTSFGVRVVGRTRGGEIHSGTAQGLLIVLGGGASVYKFYNPGTSQGDGKWRRL